MQVCDFGMARVLARPECVTRSPSPPLDQQPGGTAAYMAPELFEGAGVYVCAKLGGERNQGSRGDSVKLPVLSLIFKTTIPTF